MIIIVCHFQPRKIKSNLWVTKKTNFVFFFLFSFPFEWKSPIGYVVAVIIQSIGLYTMTLFNYSAIFFVISHCVFIIVFCSDRDQDLHMLNESIKTVIKKKKKLSTNCRIEVKKKLCKFIRFQCETKQLSE